MSHPDAKVVALVHAETSTGVCSDVKTLCAMAKNSGCLTIVDSVTGLAGVELRVDDWQIDVAYSGRRNAFLARRELV